MDGPPAVAAPSTLLSEAALAKVEALYELLEESRDEHGVAHALTVALEAKLEDARREYLGGAGPREVMAAGFGPNDERWVDGCVAVEGGWFVSVVDTDAAWCTVRVNGLTGRVPAEVLRTPVAADADAPLGHGERRLSVPAVGGAELAESLGSAADAAAKGVTGLFSRARSLKAQLATAADDLSAELSAAAEKAAAKYEEAVDGAGAAAEGILLPLPEPEPPIGALVPRSRSASPPISQESDDEELDSQAVCRVFSASLFLRDVGDIRGRLVFTATRVLFVPLISDGSSLSARFETARDLLWSTLSPRSRQSLPSRGGDATQELHEMIFSHQHVVYFGMERSAASSDHPGDDGGGGDTGAESSGTLRVPSDLIAQSSINSGSASPSPATTPEPEQEQEPRTHQLHNDIAALGLSSGRDHSAGSADSGFDFELPKPRSRTCRSPAAGGGSTWWTEEMVTDEIAESSPERDLSATWECFSLHRAKLLLNAAALSSGVDGVEAWGYDTAFVYSASHSVWFQLRRVELLPGEEAVAHYSNSRGLTDEGEQQAPRSDGMGTGKDARTDGAWAAIEAHDAAVGQRSLPGFLSTTMVSPRASSPRGPSNSLSLGPEEEVGGGRPPPPPRLSPTSSSRSRSPGEVSVPLPRGADSADTETSGPMLPPPTVDDAPPFVNGGGFGGSGGGGGPGVPALHLMLEPEPEPDLVDKGWPSAAATAAAHSAAGLEQRLQKKSSAIESELRGIQTEEARQSRLMELLDQAQSSGDDGQLAAVMSLLNRPVMEKKALFGSPDSTSDRGSHPSVDGSTTDADDETTAAGVAGQGSIPGEGGAGFVLQEELVAAVDTAKSWWRVLERHKLDSRALTAGELMLHLVLIKQGWNKSVTLRFILSDEDGDSCAEYVDKIIAVNVQSADAPPSPCSRLMRSLSAGSDSDADASGAGWGVGGARKFAFGRTSTQKTKSVNQPAHMIPAAADGSTQAAVPGVGMVTVAEAGDGDWQCTTCTFLNIQPEAMVCNICRAPRAGGDHGSPMDDADQDDNWLIEDCLAAPLSSSSVLRRSVVTGLYSVLPAFAQVNEWSLVFSTKLHGHSLQTLMMHAEGHALTVLTVADTQGHVFGCYATSTWAPPGGLSSSAEFFGGSGECFLWRWDEAEGSLVKSSWTRAESLFQVASTGCIGMGGGGDTYGLWLDHNLDRGSSGRCETFDNPVLCEGQGGAGQAVEFQCECVELWGLLG